jgi:caffeoyl-CoA O-methyltransferase
MAEIVPEPIHAYTQAHTTDFDPILAELERETRATMASYRMQVGKVQGGFLRMLVQILRAERVLEIGTFTGYSALCMAAGLPDHGRLITCDLDPEATAMARRYWEKSPHGRKIELRLGPALDTLRTLTDTFDLAFIDADKENYVAYWEAVLPKVRSGGLLLADNVLWSGRVLDPREELDFAIDRFNRHVCRDGRVECVMLTIRDGVTLARKK